MQPIAPKILKLNSEVDLFGLVDIGFNTFLYHWVNGRFFFRYDLGSFCDSLRSMIFKENHFVIWASCFKNSAKRPIMVDYDSVKKKVSKCTLTT